MLAVAPGPRGMLSMPRAPAVRAARSRHIHPPPPTHPPPTYQPTHPPTHPPTRPRTQLKALILNDTSLGDEGVAAVCAALTQPGAAPQLEVRCAGVCGGQGRAEACALGPASAAARRHAHPRAPGPLCLCIHIPPHSPARPSAPNHLLATAQELELALNEITPAGAAAVGACVAAKPGLRRLNLRENELEDEGAVTVAKVGGGGVLQEDAAVVCAACRSAAGPALPGPTWPAAPAPTLQALVGLTALQSLDACGNQLKRGGAAALAKACARKPGLQLLALDENELSDAGIDALKVGFVLAAATPAISALLLLLPLLPPSQCSACCTLWHVPGMCLPSTAQAREDGA